MRPCERKHSNCWRPGGMRCVLLLGALLFTSTSLAQSVTVSRVVGSTSKSQKNRIEQVLRDLLRQQGLELAPATDYLRRAKQLGLRAGNAYHSRDISRIAPALGLDGAIVVKANRKTKRLQIVAVLYDAAGKLLLRSKVNAGTKTTALRKALHRLATELAGKLHRSAEAAPAPEEQAAEAATTPQTPDSRQGDEVVEETDDWKTTIAVLDLQARGLDPTVAQSTTDIVVQEIERAGIFRSITMNEIKSLLEHEKHKAMLGCDDASCLAEIGGALGADLLLSGGVGQLGDTYIVALKLIRVRQAEVVAREERTVSSGASALIEASRQAARALLRPIVKEQSGTLALSCTEEGAEVYLDDVMVGTTPLEHRSIPGGYHHLRVAKKRFVIHAQEIRVQPNSEARLEVTLVPSAEYREEYEAQALTYRALAWTFSGLGVAAAGAAVGLFVWNQGRLETFEQDRDEYKVDRTTYDYDDLAQEAEAINLVDSLSLGLALGAAACTGAALYFWLAGEPPGKYETSPGGPTPTAVSFGPSRDGRGLLATVQARF